MSIFDGLKQAGDTAQMIQKARAIQQKLSAERVEVSKQTSKGLLKLVLSGDLKVVEASYDGVRDRDMESALSDVLYKAQMIAASQMKELTGGTGL